jgi:hypothetical protein
MHKLFACKLCGFLAALLSIVLVGCGGSSPKSLTGKVTYKGTAAQKVIVRLISADGTAYEGRTDSSGNFEVPSVPDAEYKVAILSIGEGKTATMVGPAAKRSGAKPPDKEKIRAEIEKQKAEYAKSGMNVERDSSSVEVPAKYTNPETSGLSWSTKETKKKDFDLTD